MAEHETPRWVGQAKKPRAVPIDDFPTPRRAPPPTIAAAPPPVVERGLALVSASLLRYQGAAEQYARANACGHDPVASLAAIDPLTEIYTVVCTSDEAMAIHCDANACHAMK